MQPLDPVIVVVIAGVRLCYDYYVRLKQRKRLFFPRLFSHIVFTVFYSAEHFTAPHWAKTTYSKRAFSFSKTKSIVCMKFVRHLCPRPAPARESFSFMKESSRREPAQPSVPITNNGDHSAENRNSEMPTWLELECWYPVQCKLLTHSAENRNTGRLTWFELEYWYPVHPHSSHSIENRNSEMATWLELY